MGWGYRKSRRLAPGIRLNLSKRGFGISAGPRGAKVSVNSRGQRSVLLSKLGFFFRRRI